MAIMQPNPRRYFQGLVPRRDAVLQSLEEEARQAQIPIVGPVVGQLLCHLAAFAGAKQILELGTASGYSAIYLARGCVPDGRVITLEKDPGMAQRARANLTLAGVSDRVNVVAGDAVEALVEMRGVFDLIFIDIEKADYVRVLPDCWRLLRPNGLLVADNTAFADADSFNRAVNADDGLAAVNLLAFFPHHAPEEDAVSLVLRLP
jgi:predicted O-methyltransferase YrrM